MPRDGTEEQYGFAVAAWTDSGGMFFTSNPAYPFLLMQELERVCRSPGAKRETRR